MSCGPLIHWDGRDWRRGQRFRVPPNPARRCPGFGGRLRDLEPQPGQAWAIVWYINDLGTRLSTTVRPGEMLQAP